MAAQLIELGLDDLAEVVECLLIGADTARHEEIAARRRALADGIGDALDSLPAPTAAKGGPQ
ncbi:hypothetical protein PH213_20610 [Streptomyces sp. SRF1]|uniref:hypothetical protein n=1 Tax=Streptomyces sp. SRF1 TaxID=1549642 RepID=UPI0025AF6CDE|nr:hypothetical protein [Streptomyces sp. SRF1]MDN3056909.1 hypothetical protein [Streptomyces sp. SRF1]